MNLHSLAIATLALAALAAALFAPPNIRGQAAAEDALTPLVAEVAAQQAVLAGNQAKIDAKLAAIGENLRLARIYAGRSR